MPASTEQKVDFLLKKIGYSASKTGGVEGSSGTVDGTKKKPSEEAIPSPLIIPSTNIWADSSLITATPPGSDTFPIKVYATASAYRLTADNTVSESRSFIARSTYGNSSSSIDGNWIDSQFGADYAVRVFKGDPNSGGVELSQAGATGNDTWFFDYSSGILNFNGTDNHSTLGVTNTNIYILGYRYTGGIGVKPVTGIGTFSSLNVTGIATFHKDVEFIGAGDAGIKSTFWDQSASSLKFLDNVKAQFGDSQDLSLYNDGTDSWIDSSTGDLKIRSQGDDLLCYAADDIYLMPNGNDNGIWIKGGGGVSLYHNNLPRLTSTGYGVTVTGLEVTGISTFTQLVDINGGGQANTFKVEDLTPGYVTYAGSGGELQDSANLTFDGTDLTAASAKISDLTDNRVVIAGSSGALGDSANLTFDANSNLNVTGGIKVTGVSTFSNDIRASANLSVTGISTLGSIGISTGLISGPATMYIDPATVGDNTGLLVVKGNLQVDGTQTTVNSSTMTVTDKNIEIAKGAANDAAADGAGITIDSGEGDKTWNWVDTTDAWTSSEHIQVAAGKQLGFADDPNTYIDRPSADSIRFTAGGSEKVRIQTDGNTKITGALSVSGISTFTGLVDINGGGQANTFKVEDLTATRIVYSGTGGELKDNSKFFYDETSLNVGYSGTSFGAAAGFFRGSATAYDGGDTEPTLYVRNRNTTAATNFASIRLDTSGNGLGVVALNALNNSTSASADFAIQTRHSGTIVERLRIISSGNVGINSTSPTTTLDVRGTVQVSGISTFNNDVYLPDGKVLRIGNSSDLQLYHDGHSHVSDRGGTGSLFVESNDLVAIRQNDTANYMAKFEQGAAVKLYYNNVLRLQTLERGVGIGGSIHIDNDLYVTGIATIGTGVGVTTILDEDDMVSNSATALVTQQSVKAYVDTQVTAQDLDFQADTGGALSIDLDSEVLGIVGTSNEIETAGSGNNVTIGLPDDVTIGNNLTVNNDLTVASNAGIGSLSVTGVSTFTGNIDANGNLDVDGQTDLDVLNVAETATFSSNIDANGDLDVDGQTEVDDINVAGVSTFVGVATFTSNHVYIDNKLFVGGIEISPGAAITTPNLDINDYIRHNGDLTTKFGFPTDGKVVTNISGTERTRITSAGTYTTGIATATGVINSLTDVQINGVSVSDTALNDAVAMAIALG